MRKKKSQLKISGKTLNTEYYSNGVFEVDTDSKRSWYYRKLTLNINVPLSYVTPAED